MSRFGTRPRWYTRWTQGLPRLPAPPLGTIIGAKKGPKSRLYRRQSPTRMRITPSITGLFGSMLPLMLPIFADMPILPPIGFIIFLAWRLLRADIWALWAGFPLGLFDDVFSGQPFGSGALLWSVALLTIELIEQRQVARDYIQNWIIAGVAILIALLAGAWFVGLQQARPPFMAVMPQIIISVLVFPLVMRVVAGIDRWRLAR